MSFKNRKRRRDQILTSDEEALVIAVRHCARELDDVLQGARRKSERIGSSLFAKDQICILHRCVELYAELLDKVSLSNRQQLDQKLGDADDKLEIADAIDDISETEGYLANFLENLDQEVGSSVDVSVSSLNEVSLISENDAFQTPVHFLDFKTGQGRKIEQLLDVAGNYIVLFLQPSYLPHAATQKMLKDFAQEDDFFNTHGCTFTVITWGSLDCSRKWAKSLKTKNRIFLCKDDKLPQQCGFRKGFRYVWNPSNLQYLGELQRAKFSISLPPPDLSWDQCLCLGGTVVLNTDGKVLKIHTSTLLSDYLTPSALKQFISKNLGLQDVSKHDTKSPPKLSVPRVPPDMTRVQYEPTSGLYYDPLTGLYYDCRSTYFYHPQSQQYLFWNSSSVTYEPVTYGYSEIATPTPSISQADLNMPAAQPCDEPPPADSGEEDLRPPGVP